MPAHGSRSFDVVGLGQNSVDLVAVVGRYPAVDTKQELRRFERLPGGQIATALAACARLGCTARYLGRFGGDDLGVLAEDALIHAGVDTSLASKVPGARNRLAVALVEEATGKRTVLWTRDPRLGLAPQDVPQEAIASGRLLLVDAEDIAAATEAARAARAAGTPVVLDVEEATPPVIDLVRHADAIIARAAFFHELTGTAALGRALKAIERQFGTPLVCATLGEEGSLSRSGGVEIRTRAHPVDAVDTTGAGDVFHGAFAAACLRWPNGSVERALEYASAAAALSCRGLGAQGCLPTHEQVADVTNSRVAGLNET